MRKVSIMAKRSYYDKQFKIAVVKMIIEDDIPVKSVAGELNVHQNTIYRWLKEYEMYGEDAFPGHGSRLYSYQFEIKKLQKENKQLKEELEILKKYRAFLKKKSM